MTASFFILFHLDNYAFRLVALLLFRPENWLKFTLLTMVYLSDRVLDWVSPERRSCLLIFLTFLFHFRKFLHNHELERTSRLRLWIRTRNSKHARNTIYPSFLLLSLLPAASGPAFMFLGRQNIRMGADWAERSWVWRSIIYQQTEKILARRIRIWRVLFDKMPLDGWEPLSKQETWYLPNFFFFQRRLCAK